MGQVCAARDAWYAASVIHFQGARCSAQPLPSSAIAAGVSVVLPETLNAHLRGTLGSAAGSGFVSYLVGLLCMVVLMIALRDSVRRWRCLHPLVGVERRAV